MQVPLPVTPFEFVAEGDGRYAAHPLPKPRRVPHPKRINLSQLQRQLPQWYHPSRCRAKRHQRLPRARHPPAHPRLPTPGSRECGTPNCKSNGKPKNQSTSKSTTAVVSSPRRHVPITHTRYNTNNAVRKGRPPASEGSWYNAGTNESFHPDLSHPDPIGPHYDYRDALGNDYRVFPDGTVVPK